MIGSTEIKLPSGTAGGVSEINYSDEKGVEPRYGKGAVARGYGRKNYKASGSLTMDREEFEKLKTSMGGNVYKKPVNIVVSYGNDDMPSVTDTLPDVMFTKSDSSNTKQDSDNVSQMKLDFIILSPIKWGGVAAA